MRSFAAPDVEGAVEGAVFPIALPIVMFAGVLVAGTYWFTSGAGRP
ncbi:hypothetical protein [Streptomyces sp. NPDC050485]